MFEKKIRKEIDESLRKVESNLYNNLTDGLNYQIELLLGEFFQNLFKGEIFEDRTKLSFILKDVENRFNEFMYDKIRDEVAEQISSEKFIDSIIERINRKQLKGK